MIEFNSDELSLEGANLEDVGEDLEDTTRQTASDDRTIRAGVEEGTDNAVEQRLLPMAREAARRHVGGYAEDIQPGSGSWRGRTYRNGLVADEVVVLAHEYGSGIHRGGSRYRIPGQTEDGPLSITVNGQERVVEYVMHPGVDEEGFMRESADRSLDELGRQLVEEVSDRIDNALSGM